MFFSRQPADRSSAAALLLPPREGYVELGRRFALLSKTGERNDAADESYLVRAWSGHGRFDWEKLLKKPLVVVLGEQGSGKSWEIEYQAAKLAAAGQFAFFLRLEELIARPMAAALGEPATAIFNEWKIGAEPAIFFLDSVDESKLNGAEDFYSALKHFREALPPDLPSALASSSVRGLANGTLKQTVHACGSISALRAASRRRSPTTRKRVVPQSRVKTVC